MARKFALIDASVTPAKVQGYGSGNRIKIYRRKDSVDALRQHLHTLSGEHHAPVQLLNIYYETPDNWLRRHDMGLRIRGASGRYEMTMKIAGRVVGGLHQRPEYNIDISQPELELERFPTDVWPEGELPATLAEQVQPLFSTDFWREKWLVTEGKAASKSPSIWVR